MKMVFEKQIDLFGHGSYSRKYFMRANKVLRYLDRYLGIPLVYLLGLCKRRKGSFPLQERPKIALLHTAAIGDTILLSGVIADLHAHFPGCEIYFFVGRSNYEAAQLIPNIQVVHIPVLSVFASVSFIRSHFFDVWIDFGSWARINAVYSYFSRAKWKLGFQTPGQYRHFVYDQTATHQAIHEIENFRNLVRLINVRASSVPKLVCLEVVKDPTRIVVHPYAGGSQAALKAWPEANWAALINTLVARGYQVALTGAKIDREKCEQIKIQSGNSRSVEVVAGNLSLRETARFLKGSAAVISIDTGIMHLAAALDCFTVALHGPTSSLRWGGIGSDIISISQKTKVPCIHLGFENACSSGCDCMRSIQVEQVLEVLDKRL